MTDILKVKQNGSFVGIPIVKGEAGFSPIATVSKSGTTTTITITDINGTTSEDVYDGIGSISDVKVNNESVVQNTVANIDLSDYVKTVNNSSPDANGNVSISIPSSISALTDDTATYPIGKADYATTAGSAGSATTASKLGSTDVGSATQPIYLDDGVATACTYSLNKTVPNNAVFTDTTYSFSQGSSNGTIAVSVNGGTATDISVKGLGSAAYTNSSAYAAATATRFKIRKWN